MHPGAANCTYRLSGDILRELPYISTVLGLDPWGNQMLAYRGRQRDQ